MGVATLNDQLKSLGRLFGGSSKSASVTSAALSVTVQVSPTEKSAAGSREYVVGPGEAVAACAPLAVHVIPYHVSLAETASLKVIDMVASTATPVAPFAGEVEATVGS